MAGQLLQTGSRIVGHNSGLAYVVDGFLGAGGQGEVYQVREASASWALKWYFPWSCTPAQISALDQLVRQGPPNDRYLWPLELAIDSGKQAGQASSASARGYIMSLREDRFHGLVDLITYRVQPTFKSLTVTGRELADSFLQLHSRGFCYRDISFGNVFFDPGSGDVLICDNDNVGINGTQAQIKGTPKFMAPEVVRDEATPSSDTDRYSLAVLLFYVFMRSHPLEGAREAELDYSDPELNHRLQSLYGGRPLFVFDPEDPSNRPDPSVQKNALAFWDLYPKFFRELFMTAFTAGLNDPNARINESVWRTNMVRLRDAIVNCPGCDAENFYDSESDSSEQRCWRCGIVIPPPVRLLIGKGFGSKLVVLNADTKLYPYHLGQFNWDFSDPVASVVRDPARPGVFGLKNTSASPWVARSAVGQDVQVPVGSVLAIRVGTSIDFGRTTGTIQA